MRREHRHVLQERARGAPIELSGIVIGVLQILRPRHAVFRIDRVHAPSGVMRTARWIGNA